MIIGDLHVEYLLHVESGKILFFEGKYIYSDGVTGYLYFNQGVALHVAKLGLTIINYVSAKGHNVVSLSRRGEILIQDESEAWE